MVPGAGIHKCPMIWICHPDGFSIMRLMAALSAHLPSHADWVTKGDTWEPRSRHACEGLCDQYAHACVGDVSGGKYSAQKQASCH